MAHYSIFIPGVKGATDAHLERFGLSSLCREGGASWTEVIGRGPGGHGGMVGTWTPFLRPDADPLLGYFPDRQKWIEHPDGWWYGHEPERPVTPQDVQFKQTVGGAKVALADGQHWLVPHATRLPHRHAMREGRWSRVVHERYQSFYDRAQKNMQVMFHALDLGDWLEGRVKTEDLSEEPVRFTVNDGASFCCESLAINHRVTPEIVDLLGLLDDRSMVAIFWTTMEMQEVLEVRDQKKTSEYVDIPVGLSTSPGK